MAGVFKKVVRPNGEVVGYVIGGEGFYRDGAHTANPSHRQACGMAECLHPDCSLVPVTQEEISALLFAPGTAPGKDDDKLRALARKQYADPSNGDIEVDEDARISRGEDGTFVQAWVWVRPEPEFDPGVTEQDESGELPD